MREHAMTNELVCTWVVVNDSSGRCCLEAHWAPATAVAAADAA